MPLDIQTDIKQFEKRRVGLGWSNVNGNKMTYPKILPTELIPFWLRRDCLEMATFLIIDQNAFNANRKQIPGSLMLAIV